MADYDGILTISGGHAPQNVDGSVTLTAGQLYAFKAMVGDRGGDAFIVDFSGPAGSNWSSALSDTGRDGTGFYYHSAFAPNGYNLNS